MTSRPIFVVGTLEIGVPQWVPHARLDDEGIRIAMWKRAILVTASAAAALVVAGCGNSSDTGSEHQSGHTTSASATAAPTTTANAEAHNQADVMFAQHMIPHHQQAIEMSEMVLGKQGIDQRVTELATQIKAAQGPEIEKMRGWLKQWGSPQMPMPSGGAPGHGDMPMPSMSGMPGMSGMSAMMSEADMTALQNAQGVEATKLFLTQMITHHEGAITMSQTEIKDGQYPATVELARSIVTSQQKEIDTMKGILATL
jgi:uncharacterized protein (DUF305 family)